MCSCLSGQATDTENKWFLYRLEYTAGKLCFKAKKGDNINTENKDYRMQCSSGICNAGGWLNGTTKASSYTRIMITLQKYLIDCKALWVLKGVSLL